MMDNAAANKSHIPCQSWVGQNGLSAASAQGSIFNPLSSSQHLSLDLSSGQRPSCDHLQASTQSCMSDIISIASNQRSALYKSSHSSSNSSSMALFSNNANPTSSHSISFAQQNPHTSSMLLTTSQGKNVPPSPLPQTNQASQPCRPQQLPLLSSHDPYKALFQPPLINQGLPNGLQDLLVSFPSCGRQRATPSRASSEGASVEFAGVSGNTHSHASSSSQEQRQWMPSSNSRGTANKSVPDPAANTSPQAGNDRRRSELLNQRALLLQQLAELNKHLESIASDDNSDAQSPHTDVQTRDAQQVRLSARKSKAKSRFPADRSSATYYDDHDETFETPEYPESDAESVNKENAQSEEGSDPDYMPNSEGDISESEKSNNSSPPTPTAERPSPGEQKRAKLRSSLLKARSATKKKTCEAVVLPTSNTKEQRQYDRRNYCVFCSKPLSKIARHFETAHSDKTEVAAAFQYPKRSRERRMIWNRLINQGNFAHNKKVLKNGKGHLAVRKRPRFARQAGDFLHCLYCRGLYIRKAMFRHMKSCPERARNGKETRVGRSLIAVRCVLEASDDLGISDGFKGILSKMTYNEVTQTVMDDKIILQFGELLFDQYGSDAKKHDYIKQHLRQIGRLVLEAQKKTPLKNLEDFFLPSNFQHVVSAVNVLAGYDSENKRYRIPSLAIKLGYILQKTCGIVEDNAVKSGDERLAESARKFLSVYRKKWNKLVSSGALTTLRETKSNTEMRVPFAQDVKLLSFHVENIHLLAEQKLRESPCSENYAALAKAILARTIFFNRRRATEVSVVQLKDFMSRKKSELHAGMDLYMSDLERTMSRFFTRIDIRGNCGRMVPVLLKPSIESAMELFVKLRETCGVPSENPFLFGRPHAMSAYNGSECIQKYVKECGAKDPEALTSAKIRKHYATMLQMMNLDENEADQILGPNNKVQDLRQNSNMELNDIEMDCDERLTPARGRGASWNHSQHPGARYGKQRRNGTPFIPKHKWEEAEVVAVERHMMRFIKGHKVPQKNDCVRCLEAEPEALRTRSWRGVKDYVRNRITSLKNVKQWGAKEPEAPKPKKIKKNHTTRPQLLDLDEIQTGPYNQVQQLRHHSGMQQDECGMDSNERLQPPRGQHTALWNHNQHPSTDYGPAEFYHQQAHGATTGANMTVPQKSVNSGKRRNSGSPNSGVHKWQEAEVLAVERHMMIFIKGHKIPQKNDCVQCLEAEPEALRNRSWKGVKDYVRNRITALKRQGGTSQALPTNNNWSGQVEPQPFQSYWTE